MNKSRQLMPIAQRYIFQLTKSEKDEVVTKCDYLNRLRYFPYLPYALTEQAALEISEISDRYKKACFLESGINSSTIQHFNYFISTPQHFNLLKK